MNVLIVIPSFFSDSVVGARVNMYLALICFVVMVSSFVSWISYAEFFLTKKNITAQEIVLGKSNWYAFRFSTPSHFDTVGVGVTVPSSEPFNQNPLRHRISEK